MIADLHAHSNMSDGTDSPAELVRKAQACGLSLLALTDHDTVAGAPEALREGRRVGLPVLTGVEFDTEFPGELHILGLGLDITSPRLVEQLARCSGNREERNRRILDRLAKAGVDVRDHMRYSRGNTTRLHIANALVEAGYAKTRGEAFASFLVEGRIGYLPMPRPRPAEVIGLIHEAGGVAVLAHPCKLKCDVFALIAELAAHRLDGLEAYYPTAAPGQVEQFVSLARQYGMLITAGSDYHGAHRVKAQLGCAWRDVPELVESYGKLMALLRPVG